MSFIVCMDEEGTLYTKVWVWDIFFLCIYSQIEDLIVSAPLPSLSFCSCANVWKAMIWKSKAEEKQTEGMRSRRKPVKPGDRGQLSQIHITKRSYKSSRGGVSVDPEKINPSLTIQGHQHGAHGGPAWVTTTSNKDKIYIHHSRADTVHLTRRNTICPCRFPFTHISGTHTHNNAHSLTLTHQRKDVCTGISKHEVSRSFCMFLWSEP